MNLRKDVERRKAVRQEVALLNPLQCIVRFAFRGAALVRRVGPGPNGRTCRLRLTDDAAARFGVASVLQRSKVLGQAPTVFGCALAHRAVLQEAAASDGPRDFAWVLEDGTYCPTAPDDITSCLVGLLGSALQRGHLVDIVDYGQTNAQTT